MTYDDNLITPEVWGKHVWKAPHYITLGYPDHPTAEQKEKYKAFFILLKDTLPCSVCAEHYGENLKKMPITDSVLESRESLVKWLIDFHNVVNEMKNKPIVKYVDARKMIDTDTQCVQPFIEKFTEDPSLLINSSKTTKTSSNSNFIFILIGVLFSLILIAVVYKK